MSRKETRVGWAGAAMALLALMQPAFAGSDRSWQIEREVSRYTLAADGSYVEDHERAIKILDESALAFSKDASISYSASVQKAEIREAYTLKPDGRKVLVPPSNYQVGSQAGRDGDSPMYSDVATLTVVFPNLAVGDTTVLAYRIVSATPMFERQFSLMESYSPAVYYGDVRIEIDAPVDMPLRHQTWHMAAPQEQSTEGRRRWRWEWRNREPADAETLGDSTYKAGRYPGLAISTFADYGQIARAYGDRAEAKAKVVPRIQSLADEIAGDASEPREVAKRLYEWVSRNITYAGNCIGLGAVVPRDLDVVLDNKMGDCKDHATLLQALLAAKGIDSTQALVNAGQVFELPEIPVASMVNHVINYVPSLELYMDSTAATVPFGRLPPTVAGKRVLLVRGYRDDSLTPNNPVDGNWQRLRANMRIAADGSVEGEHTVELQGPMAIAVREQFRSMGAEDAKKLVRLFFQQMAVNADGSVEYDDPEAMEERFRLSAKFKAAQMLPIPGGFAPQPWFMSMAPVHQIVARNVPTEGQAQGESACGGVVSEEELVYEFPASIRIAALPADATIRGEAVTYSATYRRQDNRITVRRKLDDRTPGPVCSPEYNQDYAELMRRILPNVRSQIVYLAGKE
ncbi:MAG TPA: DUF3857 and transglutaminase domain-containing protein [Xanthomonadaceae bacterium]|nr:DUF3857 and transglutaminase domain-containing protein [Xanthomonadaceae bacterium]